MPRKSENNFYIVLMAGGAGTRLWPISRANLPKQFHKLTSDKSLFQETYERVKDLVPKENIYVSLVKSFLKTGQKQLPKIPKENFIVEPVAKNTAPAIALVTFQIFQHDPQAIITTISSDHTIENPREFQKSIRATFKFAQKHPQYFTTLGLKPDRPETGFGYIKIGKKFPGSNFYQVEKFVEKPNLKTAQKYLESGRYLWNASYFTFRAEEMLKNYQKYAPRIYRGVAKINNYKNLPAEAFDTAIAEKVSLRQGYGRQAPKIACIPTRLIWSDIGSWSSLYNLMVVRTKNHIIRRGHHIGIDNKNCLIYSQERLLATIGLEDIIIVDTKDVTLVCHKNQAQDVKKLVEKIKKEGREKYL